VARTNVPTVTEEHLMQLKENYENNRCEYKRKLNTLKF